MEECHKTEVVLAKNLLLVWDTNNSFNGINFTSLSEIKIAQMQRRCCWWLKGINRFKSNLFILWVKESFSHSLHSQLQQGNPDSAAKLPLCYFESYLNMLSFINCLEKRCTVLCLVQKWSHNTRMLFPH